MTRPDRNEKRRQGLTLIELLVVIAIIVVLVGMLFPAAQRIRDAAHRLSCTNNLRQMGTALHNYQTTYGVFPPGGVTGPMPEVFVSTNAKHGWITLILDDLGEAPLRAKYNMDQSWDAAANQAAVKQQVKIVQCPAAPPNRFGISNAAAADYGAMNGIAPDLSATGLVDMVPNAVEAGCMYKNSRIRIRDISDGVTNTFLICEDAGRPQLYGPRRVLLNSGQIVTGAGWADRQNLFALHGSTPDGQGWPGPCAINCTNSNEIYSLHSGGANVLFADTTVRFLSADMDIRAVGRLVTRNGRNSGEPND